MAYQHPYQSNGAGATTQYDQTGTQQYSPTSTTFDGPPPAPPAPPFYVKALYPFSGGENTSAISFRQGEVIEVLSMLASGWWDGVIVDGKVRGWFPSNYVQVITNEEAAVARDQLRGWWGDEDETGVTGTTRGNSEFVGGVVSDYYGAMARGRTGSLASTSSQTFEDILNEDTSFSSGGDIFAEIAAAAQSDVERQQAQASSSASAFRQSVALPQASHAAASSPSLGGVDEEDFWVPKVTNSGQLFYYNTRTGETSRDMPIDGRGDGVQIAHDEFPQDVDDERSDANRPSISIDADWVPKLTSDGAAVYYVNVQTGERSWSPPASSAGHSPAMTRLAPVSSARQSMGGSSLLSSWTERTVSAPEPVGGSAGPGVSARRMSTYSDDSALDADFGSDERHSKGKGVEKPVNEEASLREHGEKRKSKIRARKTVATAELLEPPPPPLISELEALVTRALQDVINVTGAGGMAKRPGIDEEVDPQVERDRLAYLSDTVVAAVRTLLHSAGVLDQAISSADGSLPATPSIDSSDTSKSTTLSSKAQVELRPYTRRLASALSKLALSTRAVWGLLETTDDDQQVDEEEPSPDPEEHARQLEVREAAIQALAQARERRFENDAKLRSDVLLTARDVQLAVVNFLSEFARVTGESTAKAGGPPLPRELLRAPKALQGSLKTNAAALLLPGGGFGGNWRGNGFVTLPTPQSSPVISGSAGLASLSYSYPTKPITADVASFLQNDSSALIQEADSLRQFIQSFTSATSAKSSPRPASGSSLASATSRLSLGSFPSTSTPEDLLRETSRLQQKLAGFLTKVEDIDIAAGVDFELAGEAQSRPGSRANNDFVSATGSVSTFGESPKESDVESIIDPPTSSYRSSVQEARPLLAELEVGKQALYDVAPALLAAIQELFTVPAGPSTAVAPAPTMGPQPVSTSPLQLFVSPARVEFGPATILEVLSDLTSSVTQLCKTIVALGAIAETQASAPRDLRQNSLAFRSSLFDNHTSPSTSSVADSRAFGKPAGAKGGQPPNLSPSSSRQSLARTDDDWAASTHSRDSGDSYFFSKGPETLASASTTGVSSTTTSSGGQTNPRLSGSSQSYRTRVSTDEPATPPAASPSKKKLAKLLGPDAPSSSKPKGEATPPWLAADYGEDEISFYPENKQVKGGTLRALVIAACSHEGRVDSNYLSAFLMTYRTFCSADVLLDLLIERYSLQPPEEFDLTPEQVDEWNKVKLALIRARVANFLKAWVREHMDDDKLEQDRPVLQRIKAFAASNMRQVAPAQALQIEKSVDDRLSGNLIRKLGNLAPGATPPSIVPRNRLGKLKFTDIDPLELARQLTIKDGALFGKITPQECLGKAWPKQFGNEAPNISTMIDMSNSVTRWVTETILSQDDMKKRATVIKHFISVADRCLYLNNFSTLIHIIAGLNSTPIHRLRRTWETVSQKSMSVLAGLNNIMRPDKNYKVYREALRAVTPPCVPFLGVYLTDWTFIGDGNPDMLREKPHQINFNKRQKASELILMIRLHQVTTYNLSAVPMISKWLDDQLHPKGVDPATDDQRLYEISLQREPRERDDEKIARLLSESGFL
ncbi:cell division control protein Cdc25 [Pseudohyphozyma bogoriensis]|nr:cell division control protein Cdc25 [Pseudohyphozyma bogoriensis]